jgi:nitrate/nitrite-specific signal transduction histidine kinase
MGTAPGDAGNRITRVATASAMLLMAASVHIASAIESPGHLRAQAQRVARSVPYKHPARVRANGRNAW